jgi:hypothetical protein
MKKKQAKDFDTHFFMECNPNIYPDAFHATVFVKVRFHVLCAYVHHVCCVRCGVSIYIYIYISPYICVCM